MASSGRAPALDLPKAQLRDMKRSASQPARPALAATLPAPGKPSRAHSKESAPLAQTMPAFAAKPEKRKGSKEQPGAKPTPPGRSGSKEKPALLSPLPTPHGGSPSSPFGQRTPSVGSRGGSKGPLPAGLLQAGHGKEVRSVSKQSAVVRRQHSEQPMRRIKSMPIELDAGMNLHGLAKEWFGRGPDPEKDSILAYRNAVPRGMTNPPQNPLVREMLLQDLEYYGTNLTMEEWPPPPPPKRTPPEIKRPSSGTGQRLQVGSRPSSASACSRTATGPQGSARKPPVPKPEKPKRRWAQPEDVLSSVDSSSDVSSDDEGHSHGSAESVAKDRETRHPRGGVVAVDQLSKSRGWPTALWHPTKPMLDDPPLFESTDRAARRSGMAASSSSQPPPAVEEEDAEAAATAQPAAPAKKLPPRERIDWLDDDETDLSDVGLRGRTETLRARSGAHRAEVSASCRNLASDPANGGSLPITHGGAAVTAWDTQAAHLWHQHNAAVRHYKPSGLEIDDNHRRRSAHLHYTPDKSLRSMHKLRKKLAHSMKGG